MTAVVVNPWGPQEPPARVLVLGGGYTGQRFAAALERLGVPTLLTCRGEAPPGGRWLRFDPAAGHQPGPGALEGVSHGLVTIPPDADGKDPVLGSLGPTLAGLPLRWLGYLSTTGVYGDQAGAWVEETTPPAPGPGRSSARLACENAWRARDLPLQVLRLPAIYGPWRNPFAGLRQGTARLVHKPGQVFSRIHVDDIVGALLHLIALPPQRRPSTLILADNAPCPSSELLGYAAHLLGLPLPAVQPYATIAASLSPMARSFWQENRRAGNGLLCGAVGYRLRYPTYREGLLACLAEEQSAGSGGGGPTPGTPSS
ncbi:MAG: SDR family NAD(P)-dependent oxidoreductase [Prochlorococcaceae cyanobacterium]